MMMGKAIFFFGLALISLSMTLTTLFTDSKLAPQVGMYLLLLPTSLFFYAETKRMDILPPFDDSLAYRLFPLTYLMPHFSFSVVMLQFYIKGGPQLLLHLNVDLAWYCLIGATPFYLLVYMYMDGVIPNAFGIRESCCFCFKCRRGPRNANWQDEIDQTDQGSINRGPVAIRLVNLSKKFGSFQACDEVKFNVHRNEIMCLLGHNGAGKTTTINMLTGMLEPSSGDAIILGNSLCKDLAQVRKDLGLCQ